MSIEFSDLVQFGGALALIFLLAPVYRAVQQNVTGPFRVQVLLGAVFGLVAVMEMYDPIEPFEGMLIDMRAVPVALAGAFLGWTGLLVCMSIAIGVRIEAGGIGVPTGVIGILMSGMMGRIWHILTQGSAHRGLKSMFGLGIMVSTNLMAALSLPGPLYLWFFKEMAAPLTVLNLITIPVSALLIERERCRILNDERMKASAGEDFASGLMQWLRFRRDLQSMMTAGQNEDIAGLAIVRIHHRSWLSRAWGDLVHNMVLGGLRARLDGVVSHPRLIGLTPDFKLVLPLSAADLAQGDTFGRRIADAIAADRFELSNDLNFRVTVSVSLHSADTIPRMLLLLDRVAQRSGKNRGASEPEIWERVRRHRRGRATAFGATRDARPDPSPTDALFRKAARLMAR